MLVNHTIPRCVVHLDEMALGVAYLGDDMTLRDPPKLRVPADEVSFEQKVSVERLGIVDECPTTPVVH